MFSRQPLLLSPEPIAAEHSAQLLERIGQRIKNTGPLSFADFMQMALYEPGFGYYSAGCQKFGEAGDFVTAPEISPLFSRCLARQCQQVLQELGTGDILEFGAGSGIMAANLLQELAATQSLPQHYYIIEISADLTARQRQLLQKKVPFFMDRIQWLSQLPQHFCGIMLANEVLDAMPVHRFQQQNDKLLEYYVDWQNNELVWRLEKPSSQALQRAVELLQLADGYTSEINLLLPAWFKTIADHVQRGLVLLIDYGFPAAEYYHPDRSMGTLMCHYRHHAHDNPLILVGLQDITAHVDFTAVERAAANAGLKVAGYARQAQFLLNLGLLDFAISADAAQQLQISQQIKRLTWPTEMGELFKAMAITKDLEIPNDTINNH